MVYIYYLLLFLGIALFSLIIARVLMRTTGLSGGKHPTSAAHGNFRQIPAGKGKRTNGHGARDVGFKGRAPNGRSAAVVPTPWGWPAHDNRQKGNLSGQLHDFADRLMARKQSVDSNDYLRRKNANVKAMVEDRYGRSLDARRPPPGVAGVHNQPFGKTRGKAARHKRREMPSVKPWGW